MPVGRQGSADVTVSLTDSGGTPRLITDFVMELGAAKIEVKLQRSDAFADLWDEYAPTGRRSSPAIPVSGLFDTTTVTGPHVVLRPVDADALPNATARVLVIVFGDAKTFTVSVRIADYEVQAKNAVLTEFKGTLQPTGAAVWT